MKFDLNHLMDLAGKLDYKPDCQIHRDNLAGYLTSDRAIAIVEALRALEQRAEAAEAKLAALEKRPPVAYITERNLKSLEKGLHDCIVKRKPIMVRPIPLFTSPAPAADLAELVPKEMPPSVVKGLVWRSEKEDGLESYHMENLKRGYGTIRAAILRNIKEAK